MDNAIDISVISTRNNTIGEVVAWLFAVRSQPEGMARDYKHLVWDEGDTLIVATEPVSLTVADVDSLTRIAPSGSYRTLLNGTKVCVWQEDI